MSVTERQTHRPQHFTANIIQKRMGWIASSKGTKHKVSKSLTALGQQQDSCLLQDALPDCHSCFQQVGIWRPFISLTYRFPSAALSISGATAQVSTDRTLVLEVGWKIPLLGGSIGKPASG